MKRILLFFVVCCIALNSMVMCTFAASADISFSLSDIQDIIAEVGERLSGVDAVDRSKSFLLAKGYLSTDDGVDTLISIIENDEFSTNPVVADIYNVIGDITDRKEQFIFLLKFVKCFTPEERVDVLETFYARDDIGFTSGAKEDIREIFEYFNPDTTIDTIEDENTVTGAMIASLFSIFEGHLMLTDTTAGSDDFELKEISSVFEENFDALLSEYTFGDAEYTAESFIENMLVDANEIFPANIKDNIKTVFGIVGIYEAKESSSSSSSSSSKRPGSGVSVSVKPGMGSGGSAVDKSDMSQYGYEIPKAIFEPEKLLEAIANAEGTTPGTGTETPGTGTTGSKLKGFDDCVEHWSDGVTTYLKYRGTLKGDAGTNDYRPDFKINREEMAAIVMRYLEDRDGVKAAENSSTVFSDENEMSTWAVDSIAYLTEKGILKGYPDGNYRPKQEITREEAVAVISRVLANKYKPLTIADDYADHDDIGDWAKWDVNYVSSLRIANGYTTGEFLPKNNITRAEVASLVFKMMCVEGIAK